MKAQIFGIFCLVLAVDAVDEVLLAKVGSPAVGTALDGTNNYTLTVETPTGNDASKITVVVDPEVFTFGSTTDVVGAATGGTSQPGVTGAFDKTTGTLDWEYSGGAITAATTITFTVKGTVVAAKACKADAFKVTATKSGGGATSTFPPETKLDLKAQDFCKTACTFTGAATTKEIAKAADACACGDAHCTGTATKVMVCTKGATSTDKNTCAVKEDDKKSNARMSTIAVFSVSLLTIVRYFV